MNRRCFLTFSVGAAALAYLPPGISSPALVGSARVEMIGATLGNVEVFRLPVEVVSRGEQWALIKSEWTADHAVLIGRAALALNGRRTGWQPIHSLSVLPSHILRMQARVKMCEFLDALA